MANRDLTPTEADAVIRLRRIWDEKKRALQLTQEKVAHLCGWGTQGAFGHYLQGRAPLNTDAVLKLAKVLQVAPEDIMPELIELLASASGGAISPSTLQLIQTVKSLPDPAQSALRAFLEAVGCANPPKPALSEEALRLAQAIDTLPSRKREVLWALIDTYVAEES